MSEQNEKTLAEVIAEEGRRIDAYINKLYSDNRQMLTMLIRLQTVIQNGVAEQIKDSAMETSLNELIEKMNK
jgi:hypothetical protein